ncbi:MAG: DUF1801 domain-containing protein [Myxococcales bacterium]|nr:DUF1801 domain-containing protein [Myxococcales bacterium]
MPANREVSEWLDAYTNPMAPVVRKVRAVILDADPRIGECIKWKSPTFVFRGNLASFQPRITRHACLMFHTGAHIPGVYPSLEGTGGATRYMRFTSLADVDRLAHELRAIVRAWCDLRAEARSSGRTRMPPQGPQYATVP